MVELNSEMSLTEVFDVLENNNVKDIDNYGLWYDWFCSEKALVNRGNKLLTKLKNIKESTRFDKDTTYVLFKNNCPDVGQLYDDFRICDKETGNVLYTVVPCSSKGTAEIWGRENGKPDGAFSCLLKDATWKDVKEFFSKTNAA